MDSSTSELLIVFATSYLLTALVLLAYKAALNDLNVQSIKRAVRELKAVHPVALLAAFVSLIPLAVVRQDDDTQTTYAIIGVSVGYFLATLIYRKLRKLKILDFSIDTGSSFNEEIGADPTGAQKLWLFLVSWAGPVVLGTLFGFVTSYNTWSEQANWLTDQPGNTESRLYLYIFGGVIILSLLLFVRLRSRMLRRLPTANRLRAAINRSWFVPSLFGLTFALLQDFTRNTTLTNRYFTVVIFVWIGLVELWNLIFVAPNAKRHLSEDRQFFDAQQKRLRKQRNKKRRKNRR